MVPAPHIGDRSRSTTKDHHQDGRHEAVHGTLLVDSSGFQHSQVYRLAERKVRQDQREAVCKAAHHAHTARHGVRRRRYPGKVKRLAVPTRYDRDAPEGRRERPSRRGLRGHQELQCHPGQRPEGRHRLQIQRDDQGIQRQGGDAEISTRITQGHSTGYCAFGTTSRASSRP